MRNRPDRGRLSGAWWREPFEQGWYPLQSIAADWKGGTNKEVQSLKKILELPKGSRILDVGCGVGRHSVGLAKLGYRIVGLDISANYLLRAQALAREEGVKVQFIRCDMRHIPFREEFDGAINLFTSFGYFDRLSDDARVLTGVLQALIPGGIFVIDTFNLDFVRKHFMPEGWAELSDGTLVLERRHPVDSEDSIVKADWLFVSRTGKRTKMKSAIRGYVRKDLGRLFRKVGFAQLKSYPHLLNKQADVKTSPRIILSGRRPLMNGKEE